MNYIKNILLFLFAGSQLSTIAGQEKVVPFAFGDMDQWVVREIQESGIIGGNKKHLYEVGPTDTIVGNTAYHNRGGSPWANSNVMAKVAGVVKTNTSVFPERRGDGWCARLETRMESVKVLAWSILKWLRPVLSSWVRFMNRSRGQRILRLC